VSPATGPRQARAKHGQIVPSIARTPDRARAESENLLITHPKVADAAVFGVPNEDLSEEVKAVVQLMPSIDPGPDTAAELIAFCREHLAHLKCPRSVDFTGKLPRSPAGKLYKKALRARYWGESRSRIV
jgi:long-chain acyl-CoA synthetase